MTPRRRPTRFAVLLGGALRRQKGRSALAGAVVATMVAAATVAGLSTAAGAATLTSQAEGKFLSATIFGAPLAPVLNLASAKAVNNGGPTVTDIAAINATVLSAISAQIQAQLNLLSAAQVVTLGAVNQVA
ncbi:MAG: hypothetical protein JWN20_1366, partial [Jatrophihabitantaceae bacterium]|nr:hypothetical protein [Jatrophihabitantaceae bacterium]